MRAAVEHARLGRPHDLGLDHAAGGIDGHVHRQLAVQLLAAVLGEVARAALFDPAAQRVVVHRIDLFARGRADVALLRPRVLFVDALFDLGQQLQQLAAALFLLAVLRACRRRACGSGGGSSGHLAADLRQQLLLLLLQLLDLLARVFAASPSSTMRRARQRRGRAARCRLAAAGQVGLRDRLRLGRRARWSAR